MITTTTSTAKIAFHQLHKAGTFHQMQQQYRTRSESTKMKIDHGIV